MSSLDVLRQAKCKVHPCEISTGTVFVKALSSPARAACMGVMSRFGAQNLPMHEIAALGLCDQDGKLCYDLTQEQDRNSLAQDAKEIDGDDWQKIATKVFEVSGMGKEAKEEAEKN